MPKKCLSIWRSKKTWIKEAVSREVQKYFELNDNECLWNAEKAVFGGKHTALNTHVRKQI